MRRLLLFMGFMAVAGCALSQTNCSIKHAYAFYTVSIPGAQIADEQGNPVPPKPNISRLIYVEYSGTKAPEISGVSYNNAALNYTVVKLKDKTVSVGDEVLNPPKRITAKKGNSFLLLRLQPQDGKTMPEVDCTNIIIKSKLARKCCNFYVGKEKEFAGLPAY